MEVNMSINKNEEVYNEKYDLEKVGNKFISRIKEGIITPNFVINSWEDYNVEDAEKSFDEILNKREINSVIFKPQK